MGKKNKKSKKKKEIIPFTVEERKKQIDQIRLKLHMFGLANYNEKMEELQKKMDEFVKNGTEHRDIIKLEGSKRILEINMINNNKKPVKILLKYNENV